VLNGEASPVAYWSPIQLHSTLFNQMTFFEIVITILRCLSDCMLAYFARSCKHCCEFGLCIAHQAQTQFTATFTRSRKIGQHAIRQTMQNGVNYLKDCHLIDATWTVRNRRPVGNQSVTGRRCAIQHTQMMLQHDLQWSYVHDIIRSLGAMIIARSPILPEIPGMNPSLVGDQ